MVLKQLPVICLASGIWFSVMAQDKPNVIIVLTDDQGYGEVAAHGNEFIRTPHLDELHDEGVRLTDFHVNNVCSPSRAAIMTGKYATSVGVWHTIGGTNILNIEEKTMADVFRENDYKTYMVGKWHLGDNYPYRPEDRGFDEVLRIGGGSLGQVADYWENGLWDGHYWNGNEWVMKEGYCTDVQFDAALNFIDRAGETPFFLHLATTAPHSPIGAAPEYVEPYLEMGLSKGVANFYGMVTSIDENMGRLRAYLSKKNLEENTILIFMSDNGSACAKKDTSIFNAGMRGKKGSDYEGGHRVPCFVYWPGGDVEGGKSLTQLTAHLDILPTLIEACDLSIEENIQFDGESILTLLRDTQIELPDRVIVSEGKVNDREKLYNSSCVMNANWRLVSGSELYDMQSDPGQKKAIDDKARVEEMREQYMNWHSKVSEAFDHEYCFVYSDSASSVPFVTMDLLPDGKKNKPKSVWNQSAVKKGVYDRGVWNIEFPEDDTYTFQLSRVPIEAENTSYDSKKLKNMNITGASVTIDGVLIASSEGITDDQVKLEAKVSKGQHKISANFRNNKKESFSAYYLYISRD